MRHGMKSAAGRAAVYRSAALVTLLALLPAAAVLPGATPARAGSWACTATDDGSQNPGPNCPAGNQAYRYGGITNSNGDNTYVENDMWNPPGSGHPQTVYANSPGDWEVVSDQAAGNDAVLSYPDVQQNFTQTDDAPATLSGFGTIVSGFAETMPAGGDNEAAYDIWLGSSAATNFAQEVMIWVDDHRTNPPPGTIVARPVFYGEPYTVWDDSGTMYLVRDTSETSGTVHILTMLDWLVAHGYSARTSGVNQIDFGWEICSTDGQPWTFTISKYELGLECAAGGTACWSS